MFGSNCAATTEVRVSDRYVLPVEFLSSLNKNGEKEMTKPCMLPSRPQQCSFVLRPR
jgi:hypothetical protein